MRNALYDGVTDDAGDSSMQQTEVSDEIEDDYYMVATFFFQTAF